jgi:adenosylmethionine-8-amino-7-oxononanoate aminotransferase
LTWFSIFSPSEQRRRLPNGEEQEVISVGLACSESFHGERLAKLLQPGFDYEKKVMEQLMANDYASPLSIHTSGGVTDALSDFVAALEPHLPWKDADKLDWCVSLQLEGTSAVWAAIDMLLQEVILTNGNEKRMKVAVGATSYHGPPSTSFGGKSPLWSKSYQVLYPIPAVGDGKPDEAKLVKMFESFLDEHADELGVILFEPQWGSSQVAYPWPKSLLKKYIEMAKARGIRVCCDEIMCGLGRHGNGSIFVSTDWQLDPDAVTFGKAAGGGVYPISGAIVKKGRDILCKNSRSVMQSHTYAGSSVRGLMTATEVFNEIPKWLPSIQKLGEEMTYIFRHLAKISDGMIITQGQGLMWGGFFSKSGKMADAEFRTQTLKVFRKHCEDFGVIPYFVPVGGFMVSPVLDIDVGTIYEMGERLEKAIQCTKEEVGWSVDAEEKKQELDDTPEVMPELKDLKIDLSKCQTIYHQTKSCTACTSFVSQDVRLHFVQTSL